MRPVLLVLLFIASAQAATAIGFDGRSSVVDRLPPLADLDSVILGSAAPPVIVGGLGVLLVDGSWLPVLTLAGGSTPDHLLVHGPLGNFELPLEAVAGWGDPVPAAPKSGDAVLVESGLLEGRVQSLRNGVLSFRSALDPEPLALPLANVRAARLGNAPRPPKGLRLHVTLDPARPGLDLVSTADGFALAAAPQVAVDGAVFGSLALRVEGGRRTYLSDLTPAKVQEDGLFDVVWPFTRDRALHGSPLRLGGILHAKGLVVHSAARLRWDLAGGYVRLRAITGISDDVAPEGDCVAVLRGDGRELWRARVRGGEAPRQLDLDLSGLATLELSVETGERFDIGDHFTLADAQLIRR